MDHEIAIEEQPWTSRPRVVKTARIWEHDVLEEMKVIIAAHGGSIKEHADHVMFYFPDGTRREPDIWTAMSEHYTITLPSGLQVRQHGLPAGGYAVSFPITSFSPAIQDKYK